jgi:hypothetical protein
VHRVFPDRTLRTTSKFSKGRRYPSFGLIDCRRRLAGARTLAQSIAMYLSRRHNTLLTKALDVGVFLNTLLPSRQLLVVDRRRGSGCQPVRLSFQGWAPPAPMPGIGNRGRMACNGQLRRRGAGLPGRRTAGVGRSAPRTQLVRQWTAIRQRRSHLGLFGDLERVVDFHS